MDSAIVSVQRYVRNGESGRFVWTVIDVFLSCRPRADPKASDDNGWAGGAAGGWIEQFYIRSHWIERNAEMMMPRTSVHSLHFAGIPANSGDSAKRWRLCCEA